MKQSTKKRKLSNIRYIFNLIFNFSLNDYEMEKQGISTLDIENGKETEMTNGENNKDGADSNNSHKAITQRVNKILNDKTYISTDDMETTIVMNAGNCYHENISPKNYNAKRKLNFINFLII